MDFSLSEEQEMLRTMARDFLTDKYPKAVIRELEKDEKGYSPGLWNEMVELGWLGLVFPEKYGGSDMTFLDLTVMLEEIGRAAMPGPFISTLVLGGLPILLYGTEKQKQEYLPKIYSGEALFTLALTEESAGYDAASINVTAKSEGDAYVIHGTKLFVPDAHVADYMLCVVRTDDKAEPEKGMTVFIVDAKSDGLSQTLLKTMSADRVSEVVFDNVKVSEENILGEMNGGWEMTQKILEYAAVAKCSYVVGAMQQTLDMTVEYAKERKQFDRPIGSFQIIQHYFANMLTDVEGARFGAYQAAWRLNQGLPAAKEVSATKVWVHDAFERVSTLAHQIHGAIGCTEDHDLQFYTRYGKTAEISFGDADMHRELIAREMGL